MLFLAPDIKCDLNIIPFLQQSLLREIFTNRYLGTAILTLIQSFEFTPPHD